MLIWQSIKDSPLITPEMKKGAKPIVLIFESQEEALKFFKTQAALGLKFLAYDAEADHCIYSDGKTLVYGTQDEVIITNKIRTVCELEEDGHITLKETGHQKGASSQR